jgi:hypothetical protein
MVVPTLVVVAAIVAGLQFMGPKAGTDRKGDDRTVGVYGVWEPSPFRDGVQVVVSVSGRAKVDKVETVAPFSRTYPAKRGDRVTISLHFKAGLVNQGMTGVLGCSITSSGVEETHDYNRKAKINEPLRCDVVLT